MGLGNAFAGAAATAEDANTVWHNPAGLARLNFPQVEAGDPRHHRRRPSSRTRARRRRWAAAGRHRRRRRGAAFVPNLYGSMAINDQWHVGIGVNVPFGLKTDYDDGWLGRYQALKSEIKTINVNPAVAWQGHPGFLAGRRRELSASLGRRSPTTSTTRARWRRAMAAAAAGLIPASSIPALIGATSGPGFVRQDHRRRLCVGLERRHDVQLQRRCQHRHRGGANRPRLSVEDQVRRHGQRELHQSDAADADRRAGSVQPRRRRRQQRDQPDPALQRGRHARRHDAGHGIAFVLPEAQRQVGHPGRRHVDRLEQHPGTADRAHHGSLLSVLPENFKDTWRFSAGANYQYNEKIVLRAGVAYDQSPVNDIDRTPRLPDSDRTWLTIGGRYKYSTRAQLRRRRGLHLGQGRLDQQRGQSGQHRRQRPHQRRLTTATYRSCPARSNYRWK